MRTPRGPPTGLAIAADVSVNGGQFVGMFGGQHTFWEVGRVKHLVGEVWQTVFALAVDNWWGFLQGRAV
jgi:hypothetical protein